MRKERHFWIFQGLPDRSVKRNKEITERKCEVVTKAWNLKTCRNLELRCKVCRASVNVNFVCFVFYDTTIRIRGDLLYGALQFP